MLEIKNLSFGYIKKPLCINNFNLSLNMGEKVAILGGQGMAKTTFLKVLSGLENQYVGNITIDGKELSSIPLNKRNVSYLPSYPVLFENKSIKYNLKYLFKIENLELSDEEIIKVFKIFDFNYDLKTKIRKMPLDDKKIFAMIRAYIKNSQILLIDDQFENIDKKSFIKIKNAIDVLISNNSANKLIIMTCVDKNFIDFSYINKFFYLSYAKLLEIENIEYLMRNPIDLFVKNYAEFFECDMLLKKINGDYFICGYDIVSDKKRKKYNISIKNMIKVSKYYEKIANFELEDDEYIKLKVLSDKNIFKISDADFNTCLGENIFVFDDGTGERLF